MDLKETIKTLFREIEVYRSHSLFEEAQEKCRKLAKVIQQNDRVKNKQELLNIVAEKIKTLEKESHRVEAAAASAQMTTREQELVKQLFAFSEEKDEDSAAWEGATALLVFGQFKRALNEFQKLISRESLRVDAAKSILRCHIGLSSLDEAVRQYHQWLSSDQFPAREFESIRSFLQDILEKKGIKQTLPKPAASKDVREENTEEEEFIDILSIQFPGQFKHLDGQDVVLDVAYQRGNLISVIILGADQTLIKKFKTGLRIDDVQFFSPAVVFRSPCLVTAVNQILTGPQKGGHALVMQVLNE
ncbi:MAG: hypothetical protein P1P89_14640 [Desulfobacterales bacterium]|nr:hypothetical protein [Desulfobacterales bacterium]